MNVYTPQRYDERVVHLALGIEPRDALSGRRLGSAADVRLERFGRPVGEWRAWRHGETLTGVLPRMTRHASGRFSLRYGGVVPLDVDLRIVDGGPTTGYGGAGGPVGADSGRRIVPRRLRVAVAPEDVVLLAEADPNTLPHALWRRAFPVWCLPGAAADLPGGATVLRGSVVRADPVIGAMVPVRWPRIRARKDDGDDIGWAHGDDRGEFVMVMSPAAEDPVIPADPLQVRMTISVDPARPPADPGDPLRAQVDPLWDLPLETVTPSPSPTTEASLTGCRFLPGQLLRPPLSPTRPIALPLGRETSVVIQIV